MICKKVKSENFDHSGQSISGEPRKGMLRGLYVFSSNEDKSMLYVSSCSRKRAVAIAAKKFVNPVLITVMLCV